MPRQIDLQDLRGAQIQVRPATDLWNSGARWGVVLGVAAGGRKRPAEVLVNLEGRRKLGRVWVPLSTVMEC